MKTILQIILIIQISFSAFAQHFDKYALLKTINEYEQTKEKDSLFNLEFAKKLEVLITNPRSLEFDFKELKTKCDSSGACLKIRKSEDKKFLLYTLNIGWYHFNYIVKTLKQNGKTTQYKIVLKDNKELSHFTEIHTLSNNEFLLIEEQDSMVFGCNYAYVYRQNGTRYFRKKALGNRTTLTICNFTEIDNGIDAKPERESFPIRKITFDYKTKTISYGLCRNSMTGKTTKGKAKYTNGKFNIKDCDERKDFDE